MQHSKQHVLSIIVIYCDTLVLYSLFLFSISTGLSLISLDFFLLHLTMHFKYRFIFTFRYSAGVSNESECAWYNPHTVYFA